jgi:hypothetical protein
MRTEPSHTTYKELFALSGNMCAFPGCNQKIFDENHTLIGQICHIEAANPGGERYNPTQSEDKRAGFENLILLCANHHLITNDVSIYTVDTLKAMKKSHEERFKEHRYSIDQNELNQILSSIDQKIGEIKSNTKNRYDMKVEFSTIISSNGAHLLAITGMNTGDMPITLSYWGFGLPDKTYIPGFPNLLPKPIEFPYKLLPGESITVAMENTTVASYLKHAGYPDTTRLLGFFKDQINNKYEIMSDPFNNY